jgi:hypothetical protein
MDSYNKKINNVNTKITTTVLNADPLTKQDILKRAIASEYAIKNGDCYSIEEIESNIEEIFKNL